MRTRKVFRWLAGWCAAVVLVALGIAVARDPGAVLGRQDVLAAAPATLRRGAEEAIAVRVARHGSGAPVAGASVRLEREGAPRWLDPVLARAETAGDGTAALRFRVPDDLAAGTAALALVVESGLATERIPLAPAVVEAGPEVERVLLTPSKDLFKPGETLQARALLLGADGAAAAGRAVAFDLVGPSGARAARVRARTSAFGIASAEVALDAEAPEGRYRLRLLRFAGAEAKEDEGALLAEREVHVRRYRLPAFRLAVAPGRRVVRRGEEVPVTATALAFDGQPVAGAKVKAVLRDDRGADLGTAEAKTGAAGEARFALAVPETLDLGPIRERRVFVEVEAEDGAGRVAKGAAALFASEVPLRVSALPEGGALVPGVESRVFLVLEGPGGVPLGGEIEVVRDYREGPVRLSTGEDGLARLDAVRPSDDEVALGEVQLRVTAHARETDAAAEETISIRVDRAAAGLLRCDRAVYGEGERVAATFLPAPPRRLRPGTALVLLVEREGRAVGTASLVAGDDGTARGEVALPPGSAGFHRLVALVPEGDEVREVARRVLVRTDLEVTVETDRAEVAPGEEVKVRARARRPDGAPAGPCAIGLQAVDRAVAELGHAFDFRAAVLRFALAGDPEGGRLARGFAARVLAGGAAAGGEGDAAEAALGGAAERGEGTERIEATTAAACRARDAAFRETQARCLGWAAIALIPAAVVGLMFLVPRVVALLGLLAMPVVIAIAIPNLIEARKGSNEAGAVGSMRTLTTAQALFGMRQGPSAAGVAAPEAGLRIPASIADATLAAEGGAGGKPKTERAGTKGAAEPASRAEALRPPEPRSYFPEALLFAPEVLTDERGEAEVTIRMADALTEWTIDAVASTRRGSVAHARASIVSRRTFQVDLHAPAFVRMGDEVELTAAVRNDGPEPIEATVALEREPWFEPLGPLEARGLRVEPGGSAGARFLVRAVRTGDATATLVARAADRGPTDAARRPISVRPAGRLVSIVRNGEIAPDAPLARFRVAPPGGATAAERSLILRLTPNPAVEAIEGVEQILREPHGCFEQTSSAAWPNTLVLGYLRKLPGRRPEAEARALALVRSGYQRLLGFEVEGSGGFSLYGRAPASPWLTAYALREFTDIGREIDVDPALLGRIRAFLLSTQREDGGFGVVEGMVHRDLAPQVRGSGLATTAYVLAALADSGAADARVDRAGEYIAQVLERPDAVPTYTLALAAEALQAWGKRADVAARAADILAARGTVASGVPGGGARTFAFGGLAGERTLAGAYGARVETEAVAIAARVFRRDRRHRALAQDAVRALVAARQGAGWGTTQATVQALAALIQAADVRHAGRGKVDVLAGGRLIETVALADSADRSAVVDLGKHLPADGAPIDVDVRGDVQGVVSAQVVATARVAWDGQVVATARAPRDGQVVATARAPRDAPAPAAAAPAAPPAAAAAVSPPAPAAAAADARPRLALDVRYGATDVAPGAPISLRVEVANEGAAAATAPMLEVPFPAGFELATDRPLADWLARGAAYRFDEVGSGVVLYLADLAAGERRALDLRLVARHAGTLASGAARAWPYYNPEDAATVAPVVVRVAR